MIVEVEPAGAHCLGSRSQRSWGVRLRKERGDDGVVGVEFDGGGRTTAPGARRSLWGL